jgi:hypothetical protein
MCQAGNSSTGGITQVSLAGEAAAETGDVAGEVYGLEDAGEAATTPQGLNGAASIVNQNAIATNIGNYSNPRSIQNLPTPPNTPTTITSVPDIPIPWLGRLEIRLGLMPPP